MEACGVCHVVVEAGGMVRCCCGCNVRGCVEHMVSTESGWWRQECYLEHKRQLAEVDAGAVKREGIKTPAMTLAREYWDLALDLKRAAGMAKSLENQDRPSGEVIDAQRLLGEASALLARRAGTLAAAAGGAKR